MQEAAYQGDGNGGYKIDYRLDTNLSFNWQQDFAGYEGSN